MQINNNVQSPNFGMALKISKGAKEGLKNLSMEEIAKLQKAGVELKDTKFYHVKVDDDLSAKLTADKDAPFGLFGKIDEKYSIMEHGSVKEDGVVVPEKSIVMIDNGKGTIAGVARRVPFGDTEPIFSTWGSVGSYNEISDIDALINIAKIMDKGAIKQYEEDAAKLAAEKAKKEHVSRAVDYLLDTFGE